ncbi:MAG: alginate export family protein, partial [Acidobacteria bacterium]|nr:alginate export family protein [Acidobacteriota bacterium]
LFWGYHQASGDGKRGDGKRGVYDIFYASGYNEFGYLGLSRGANIRHIKVGGGSKLVGPLSLYWIYHDSYLVNRSDVWYANSTPNIFRPAARSPHIGQEINAYVNFRFPFAKYATISLGYLGFLPGAYLRTTGVHDPPQQFTIDVFGAF